MEFTVAQETILQLVAVKLKASLLVDENLAEGLPVIDINDGKLIHALI